MNWDRVLDLLRLLLVAAIAGRVGYAIGRDDGMRR